MNLFSAPGSEAFHPKDPSSEVFSNRAVRGGGRPRPPVNPAAALEPEPELLAPAPEPEEKAKDNPKVDLTDLAWGAETAGFGDKIGVRAKAALPDELKNITRIEFKVFALLPDGKREAIDKQEAHLKDGQAAAEVTLFYPQYKEDGKLPKECKFLFTAKHRDSKEAESKAITVKQPFAINVRWEKPEGWVGAPVKLLADTCLADGKEVILKIATENGLAAEAKLKAKAGKLEYAWTPCLCGLKSEGKVPEKTEMLAELSYEGVKIAPKKNYLLKAVAKADSETYAKENSWAGFSLHSEFKQKMEDGVCKVAVKEKVMKAWVGQYLDLTRAGITGTAGGCPWDGNRWARVVGKGWRPTEYHNGKKWVKLPAGHVPVSEEYSSLGFVKSGAKFHMAGEPTAVWPGKFKDYDYDKSKYKKKRAAWIKDTHDRWSGKFEIRPKACSKAEAADGCGYALDLELELEKVETWEENVITLCIGDFQSNAGCFSMDDKDVQMAAHEVGHLVGLPDEYVDGAIEPTLNGDGAVNGIDDDTIMGVNLTQVKKRHYANFIPIVEKQVKAASTLDLKFIAAKP